MPQSFAIKRIEPARDARDQPRNVPGGKHQEVETKTAAQADQYGGRLALADERPGAGENELARDSNRKPSCAKAARCRDETRVAGEQGAGCQLDLPWFLFDDRTQIGVV